MKFARPTFVSLGLLAAVFASAQTTTPTFEQLLGIPEIVPGEVLVQYKSGPGLVSRAFQVSGLQGQVVEVIHTNAMRRAKVPGVAVLRVAGNVRDAVSRLMMDPAVAFAEPNYVYRTQVVSNDTYYTNGSLWGAYGDASPLFTNQYGSQAAEAWNAGKTGSSSVYVGVIDEGVFTSHADLAPNIWTNPFDPVDGIDNDGNGYVDDRNGWDFAGNNNTVYDGTSDDHGTHCAGTIGARGGNGVGVAGVVWNVTLISGKFLGSSGGTTANAIRAVDYFTDLKTRHGLNIVATSNSWGGGGFSQGLSDAIARADAAGILFIAAAGNGGTDQIGDNNDSVPNYPSNYTSANVIAVGSITSTGARSSFSNYGATTVDLFAPGSGIWSTIPGRRNASSYGSYSGTSMATPHVSGAAALYKSLNPSATAAQIKAALLNSAVPTSSLTGRCVTGGRLNVGGF
jgi:subtilisin family serine protease